MSQIVDGKLYQASSTHSCAVKLVVTESHISIIQDGVEYGAHNLSSISLSDAIPGVATEVRFENGDMFIPDDKSWRVQRQTGSLLSTLESHKTSVFASIILAPLLIYWLIMIAMPALASKSVDWLPPSVSNYMGEQSFTILEKAFLEPSELDEPTQQHIEQLFSNATTALNLDKEHYQIFTYQSAYFGANALALPDGTVIVTDDLITQLREYDENKLDSMLMAIILHEIGHVEGKHGMRLVAQSLSNAIVFALLFGDLETVGELFVGASSTLVQASFSRDMESEADDFALQHLAELGYSPSAFADAMDSFDANGSGDFLKYLSSHPAIKERIEKAKRFK